MISKHEIGWVVGDPANIEEVGFYYPREVHSGQRVKVVSTLRNNTSELKRVKLTILNADNSNELISAEEDVGPFAVVDISVGGIVNPEVNYEAVVEEIT